MNRARVLMVVAGCWLAGAAVAAESAPEALSLSRKLDRLYRAESAQGTVRMTVETPHFTRTLELEIHSRGMEETLIRILSPPKEKGTATLKKDNTMWNYLPKIKKTIRVPPSMMMASWMGSDFTNDDLMRETSWEDDYTVSFLKDPPPDTLGLVYRPRPTAPVTWTKVVALMDAKTLLPVEQAFYDEKDRKVRLIQFSQVATVDGRTIPTRMTLVPLSDDKKGHRTTVDYLDMDFDVSLDDRIFTMTNLRRDR